MALRISSLAALTLALGTAHAGTVLETVNRDLGTQKTTTSTTLAQDGRMRVEQKPADTFMIFKDDTLFTVNNRDKNYIAMDRAAMKRMAEQINPALKQMQEQMAQMPPEQRAQMEKMMGNMPGMGKPKTQEIRKTARTDKLGGYSCSYVEKYEDGVMSEEMCVVPAASLKGSQELIDAARKMGELMQEMLGSLDSPWLKQMVDGQIGAYEKIGGIPVLTRHYSGGKPAHETTLKAIRSEAIPATAFEVPAGYAKKDMMARKP